MLAVQAMAHTARAARSTSNGGCIPPDARHLAYSTNLDSAYNSVSVVDTKALKVTRYLTGFNEPANVAALRNGSKIYVDNWAPLGQGTTSVVNPCTGAIIKTLPAPAGLPLSVLSRDGRWLYIGDAGSNTIQRVDPRTDTVVRTYNVGDTIGYAIPSPDGKTVWAVTGHSAITINLETGERVGSAIKVGTGPGWAAFTPNGERFITSNYVDGTSDSIINVATRKVIATVHLPAHTYPNIVYTTPDGSQAWVGNLDGTVSVIDLHTNKLIRTINAGKFTLGVTFSPDGHRAYVATVPHGSPATNDNGFNTALLIIQGLWHPGPCEIQVYDTRSAKLLTDFKTGGIPTPLAIPAGPFEP
jgi:YVTN family beta-propeller protein